LLGVSKHPDIVFVRFLAQKSTKQIVGIDTAGIEGKRVQLPGGQSVKKMFGEHF